MKIFSPAISRLARLRYWRIEHWVKDPVAAQREVLQDLITHGQYTQIGRRYQFSTIFNIRKFKELVPIQAYEDLKPYIDEVMQGEPDVLWNTPIEWFAKSSGTTSDKSKFIPLSQESIEDNHFQGSKDVLSIYYNAFPESDLLTGKMLVIGGSHQVHPIKDDIQYGDLSAVLLQNSPIWSGLVRVPELSIALMDEWESKIEMLAQSTIQEPVTSIAGVPTWTMVLLKRILQITGKKTIKEVWPDFELYIHGGVSFTPYRAEFKKIIGGDCNYLEIYNASEGFFAAQDRLDEEGMLIIEHSKDTKLEKMPNFSFAKTYGGTTFSFFEFEIEDGDESIDEVDDESEEWTRLNAEDQQIYLKLNACIARGEILSRPDRRLMNQLVEKIRQMVSMDW